MRILVIGGTRFMGPLVVRLLSDAGHEVIVFHRGQNTIDLPQGVQEVLGDRRSLASHIDRFRNFEPEVVLDMIPFTEQDAQEVMNTFRGNAGRVVAISSQDVYRAFGRVNNKESGPAEPGPITEDSPLREHLYPYRGATPRNEEQKQWMNDYDKILVERVVMGNPELSSTILRLPAVYGPGDYQHRMFSWLKRMDDRRPAILLDEKEAQWRWAHGYVENVAAAIVLVVTDERASGRIYNVGEPITMTMADRIRKIGEIAGWQGNIVLVPHGKLPEPLSWGINAEQDIVVDTKRIRDELGYQERIDLDEAFKRTIAWERANPPAQIDPRDFDYAAEDAILSEFM
ncbi:MAG TPA: NAD-dependent epimerase/dehydratase family protein [Ktedonobacteraceae bacterium]|jgi:nucleoside-diphosphate-sugar epimerase|nr:NAD-dependent epimerase/dehydratase family protein [Ktedonobacteraceae bacterium]